MAFSPENGAVPKVPSISYAPGASAKARSQPARASSGGSSRSSTNRAGSVAKRQQKNTTTKPRDQASGQALIAQDESFGLKRPYIPWNVYPTNLETTPAGPGVTDTTSGTFVSLLTCASEPQHARLRVRVLAKTGAATTGEVRLVDRGTGTVLFGPVVVGAASTVESNLDGTLIAPTLSGAGAPMKVDVEARTTGGGSNIGVLVVYAVGIGT